MLARHSIRVPVAVAAAVLVLGLCRRAVAFNPQPEPPEDKWRVEGFVDMWATAMEPGNDEPPLGIDPHIVSDGQMDFSAGLIATFDAPDNDGDLKPDDGLVLPDFSYFRLTIGNTSWHETMLNDNVEFMVQGGMVSGVMTTETITRTLPEHPDLEFIFNSPGTWNALDERNGHNAGTLAGTYELRDGEVPEPGTLSLLAVGALALIRRRRR